MSFAWSCRVASPAPKCTHGACTLATLLLLSVVRRFERSWQFRVRLCLVASLDTLEPPHFVAQPELPKPGGPGTQLSG
eukprot:1157095-Alexandrium_andersonii.AAC.1